jgi:hypothetical protein
MSTALLVSFQLHRRAGVGWQVAEDTRSFLTMSFKFLNFLGNCSKFEMTMTPLQKISDDDRPWRCGHALRRRIRY